MSKHEQHSRHPAKTAEKEGGCCGGAQNHECAKPETKATEQDKKPPMASQGPHTRPAHAAGGSCGCGGKHK